MTHISAPIIIPFLTSCAGQKPEQSAVEEEVEAKQPIMLGRKDYLIRSLDPSTGTEHWNVTYSEIVHLDMEQSPAQETSSSAEIASFNSLDGKACLNHASALCVTSRDHTEVWVGE